MKKLFVKENIPILLLIISAVMLVVGLFSRDPQVNKNETAIKQLQDWQKTLIEREKVLEERIETARKRDSLFFIELNKKKDENIKRIDTANNDLLRKLLAE